MIKNVIAIYQRRGMQNARNRLQINFAPRLR